MVGISGTLGSSVADDLNKRLLDAVLRSDLDAARAALADGADVHARVLRSPQTTEAAMTPLAWARTPAMADLLLAAGADVNAEDTKGCTPLQNALNHARMSEHTLGVNQVWFLAQPDTPSQNVMLSLGNWDHAKVVKELVRLIRLLRPTTVITQSPRFAAGENHGDHQACAVAATEAFDLAGDPTAFPEQLAEPREREDLLDGLKPWRPQRLLFTGIGSDLQSLGNDVVRSSMDDVSPRSKLTYGQEIADAWQWHRTQHSGGRGMTLGPGANPPRPRPRGGEQRYFLAKDLAQPAPAASRLAAFRLGGTWEFYQQFWRDHHLNHMDLLDKLTLSIQPQDTLKLPLIYDNSSDQSVPVTVSCQLPAGWKTAEAMHAEKTVAAHSRGEFEFVLHSPQSEGETSLDCTATANGQNAGSIHIAAGVSTRTMREGIAAAER